MWSSQPMQSETFRAQASELSSTLAEENMSHHQPGLDYGFPHGDERFDLYAFPKRGDVGKFAFNCLPTSRNPTSRSDGGNQP